MKDKRGGLAYDLDERAVSPFARRWLAADPALLRCRGRSGELKHPLDGAVLGVPLWIRFRVSEMRR